MFLQEKQQLDTSAKINDFQGADECEPDTEQHTEQHQPDSYSSGE